MGPLWLDIEGDEIDAEERELLQHPTVGGVILFARNYHDSEQLSALVASMRKAAGRPILIGVDQEGGRVQRFREQFTLIPPAQAYAEMDNGLELAKTAGWLLCSELVAHDIDLTFAPVLDNGFDCKAIGNRAFGDDVATIVKYSSAFMQGMKLAGTSTTGKHFPGHGGVIADSHLETPYDNRDNIFELDMAIFKAHIKTGMLDAMMPAHVVYPEYDQSPASGSSYWLKEVLRNQLNFKGLVFSDDLSMEGASIMGGPAERSQQALDAGCDMLLMCNNRKSAIEVLDNLTIQTVEKANNLLKTKHFDRVSLLRSKEWKDANQSITRAYDIWRS